MYTYLKKPPVLSLKERSENCMVHSALVKNCTCSTYFCTQYNVHNITCTCTSTLHRLYLYTTLYVLVPLLFKFSLHLSAQDLISLPGLLDRLEVSILESTVAQQSIQFPYLVQFNNLQRGVDDR